VPDLAGKAAAVSLIRADGTPTDLASSVTMTDFGSFSGTFNLDEMETPGLYRLVADVAGKPYGGEFRVRDYIKPVFYLEMIERSPTVIAGQPFTLRFKARRYSGGAPANLKYEVYLYQKKFEVPQWVMESNAALSAGSDYFGEVRSVSALTEPRRLFSSVEMRLGLALDLVNTWETAPLADESGEALFEFTVPTAESAQTESGAPAPAAANEEWIYTIMIRAMDQSGSQAVLTENIYVTRAEAQALVRFSKTIAGPADPDLKILIRSTYPDGKPAPNAGGVIDFRKEQAGAAIQNLPLTTFTTDDKGTCALALPALSGPGRLQAIATLKTLNGSPMKQSFVAQPVSMIVGGDDGKAVYDNPEMGLYTENTILSPGEKAKVFALLPAGWGEAESGTIWETIAGRKVYDTRSATFTGRSRWFEVEARPDYGTGFYHTVTVPAGGGRYFEKTLGFRIVPVDKRLKIEILPERPETDALKPFRIDFTVSDAGGKPAANTELAVTIVDKAVYAVQSELRPGIFDFFYPLPRLNLATFYSDELQGYGYADTLKKPNFELGALKSQSKLTKKNMRDTAGWFPHVVTDAAGHASVTVDMPANITEWVITAVAADRDGKAGEARAEFRTAADVSLEIAAPQFLRENENAVIYLTAVNHLDRKVDLEATLSAADGLAFSEDPMNAALRAGAVRFSIDKKGEAQIPIKIEARAPQGEGQILATLKAGEDIHVGGVNGFGIPLKPAAMIQTFTGALDGDRLILDLPETARPKTLSAQVNSGLLGAALNAAPVLATYPFGCTEQLAHTTIPNLVLMDLVRRAGIDPKDLGPLEKTLTRAEKNAAAGIRKIILNQKASGGFGLWPADPDASVPVTLTAIKALRYASELEIPKAYNALQGGLDWLSQSQNVDPQPVLPGYALASFAQTSGYFQPFEQQSDFILAVSQNRGASVSDLIYALEIFAAFKDQDWNRLIQQFKDSQVRDILSRRLVAALDRFDEKTYIKAIRSDAELVESLGFGYGVPYLISSGLGVLKTLDALPAPIEAKLKQALLRSMRNGYWISTFDTAEVIFNTRAVLSAEAEAWKQERDAHRSVRVTGPDGVVGELTRIPAGFTGVFQNPGSAKGLSEIRLEGLRPLEIAHATVTAEVPFDSVEAKGRGLTVERTLLRITPKGHEVINADATLRPGDAVISEVVVRRKPVADAASVPSRFIVVEDGIPSYARGLDEDRTYLADAGLKTVDDTYWASVKEVQRHPDRTVTIAKIAPTGELRVYQVWKVAFDGRATVPPARAFDMYDESIQGNSDVGRRMPKAPLEDPLEHPF